MKRPLLTVVFVLFALVGVAMAVSGDGADRFVGVITVLFFGLGGIGWYAGQRRRPEAAVAVGDVAHRGHPARGVVVPVRLGKWLPLTLGALGIGAGCLLMGVLADALADVDTSPVLLRIVGYGGGGFFLAIGTASLAGAIRERPKLALLADGAVMRAGIGRSFVPWDIVRDVGVYEFGVRGGVQRFAGVRTSDPSRIETPGRLRWLGSVNRGISGWDVTYPESIFDVSAEQLAELLALFAMEPDVRRAAVGLAPTGYSFDELLELLGRGG